MSTDMLRRRLINCRFIIIIIIIECIKSCFKYVSTVSCKNQVRQTIPYVNNPVSKTIFTQIILKSKKMKKNHDEKESRYSA